MERVRAGPDEQAVPEADVAAVWAILCRLAEQAGLKDATTAPWPTAMLFWAGRRGPITPASARVLPAPCRGAFDGRGIRPASAI